MAMASAFGGNAQNVMLMRSDMGSSNSLVALLNPQLINFQGGLEDAIVGHKRPFQCYQPFEGEGEGDDGDGGDGETGGPVEKKRRLSFDQVRSLERNFEMENKLEPERKMQLAKELGLQPRQVAVWFQNRRARWKTKQLERDYEMLNSGYLKLKADFETALKEKDVLKAEIQRLSGKGGGGGGGRGGDSGTTQSVESDSQCESDQKQKDTVTTTSSEGSRNSSSELLDADSPSPRTADSNHHLHEHEEALPTDPIYDFSAHTAVPPTTTTEDCDDEDAIIVAAAVKLEDHATFFLPPMVEPQGVLPWWDWA